MADNTNSLSISENELINELSQLIEQSKQQVAVQANSAVTILFWQVGNRINQEILQNKRAEYAKQIVSTLSTQLKERYGNNFELRNDFQFENYRTGYLTWAKNKFYNFPQFLPRGQCFFDDRYFPQK